MRSIALAFALLAGLLLPCAAGASWGHPGGSAANLGASAYDSALSPGNIAQATQRWMWDLPTQYEYEDDATAPVVAADGLVFVLVNRSRIEARDATTGASRWVAHIGYYGIPQVVAVGRTVYVPTSDGRLLTFPTRCRTDGGACAPRLMAQGAGAFSLPAVTSTRVVVSESAPAGQTGGKLLAFSRSCVRACAPVWHYEYAGAAISPPSAADGRAWIGTSGGSLLGFPLDCAGACQPTRKAVAGVSVDDRAPAVTTRRVYTLIGEQIVAFPADCTAAAPCRRAWRSADTGYDELAVTGSRVWSSRAVTDGDLRLEAFSTTCEVSAGTCSPAVSIDVEADEAQEHPDFHAITGVVVADGMVFASILSSAGGAAGGVKAYPATCSTPDCPSLKKFGSLAGLGASVSDGFIYLVEMVPYASGSDPYPHTNYVRAFALPG